MSVASVFDPRIRLFAVSLAAEVDSLVGGEMERA